MLDIHTEAGRPTIIKASRQALMKLTGLSENSLKASLDELVLLKLIVLKSDRPTIWQVNSKDNFNEPELMKRILESKGEALENEADSAKIEAE